VPTLGPTLVSQRHLTLASDLLQLVTCLGLLLAAAAGVVKRRFRLLRPEVPRVPSPADAADRSEVSQNTLPPRPTLAAARLSPSHTSQLVVRRFPQRAPPAAA